MVELIYELNGLINQIEDKESQERAFEIAESLEKIIKAKQVVINTPPLPESELIKYLQHQINSLQHEIYRMNYERSNYKVDKDSWYK